MISNVSRKQSFTIFAKKKLPIPTVPYNTHHNVGRSGGLDVVEAQRHAEATRCESAGLTGRGVSTGLAVRVGSAGRVGRCGSAGAGWARLQWSAELRDTQVARRARGLLATVS